MFVILKVNTVTSKHHTFPDFQMNKVYLFILFFKINFINVYSWITCFRNLVDIFFIIQNYSLFSCSSVLPIFRILELVDTASCSRSSIWKKRWWLDWVQSIYLMELYDILHSFSPSTLMIYGFCIHGFAYSVKIL